MNSALAAALCFIMLKSEKADNKRGNLEAMSQIFLLQFAPLHEACLKHL